MNGQSRSSMLSQVIIGESPAMRETLRIVEKAAETSANVCIYGESGTGKELVARAIHYSGERRGRPLITVDSAAIPEGLMESQIFGHVKGAFTGAVQTQDGVCSLADSGTLFLDEIAEMTLPLQAKLLRLIQFREFTMVGGTHPKRVDVRFVTATNKDLRRAVAEGRFRADLYYRIAVIQIALPPLRERREDIPPLAEHFIKKFASEYQKPVRQFTPRAMEFFLGHDWPGNVRQLENCIEQGVIFARGERLDLEDFQGVFDVLDAKTNGKRVDGNRAVPSLFPPAEFGGSLREMEEWYVMETLKRFEGNRTRTAEHLRVSLRGLQYKLKRYALTTLAESRSA